MVNPLGNEEVFTSVLSCIGYLSAVNDIIQAQLNTVVEIIEGFQLLDTGLDIVTKPFAEGALAMVVWEFGVDWCRFSNILSRWSVLGSVGNCHSGVVTWSGLWY